MGYSRGIFVGPPVDDDERIAMARASLEATIATLDALGMGDIAVHVSLALDRLNGASISGDIDSDFG